ncbi:MAG: hypothetical protein CVU16_09710 [Betaproteobacteria bacterium HGW-Betaproteobacteria-10]|nr:MAG: hypothetical protein CVU16_09710 [Betaproteobacteria bacterium HGW-Betaproteobacteria-10]
MKKAPRSIRSSLAINGLMVAMIALVGCQPQEGPAEKAGKEVDKATDRVGAQIEKAGEKIQDAAKGDKK